MPTLIPHHVTFSQGLRLSPRGLTLEEAALVVPSDTLFAALVDACARTGEDADAFLRPFAQGSPPFLITSAFPRAGDVRFYPVPVDAAALFRGERTAGASKQLRRVRFLSEGLFRRALAGEALDPWWEQPAGSAKAAGLFLQQGALWLMREEAARLPDEIRMVESSRERPAAALREIPIWATERAPHVAVDRVQAASDIYYVGRTHFHSGCGLWFGVESRTPEFDAVKLARLLHILEEDGLGGKRSSGNGAFTLSRPDERIRLRDAAPGAPAWLLSRLAPRTDELPTLLQDAGARYRVASLAGWMRPLGEPALRRKRLALIEEGSWVAPVSPLLGQIVDVRPADWVRHPVYRYGFGVAAGVAQEAQHE